MCILEFWPYVKCVIVGRLGANLRLRSRAMNLLHAIRRTIRLNFSTATSCPRSCCFVSTCCYYVHGSCLWFRMSRGWWWLMGLPIESRHSPVLPMTDG